MATPTKPSLAFKLETWAIDILLEHTSGTGYLAGSENANAGSEEELAGASEATRRTFGGRVLAGSEFLQAGSEGVYAGATAVSVVHHEEESRATSNRVVCKATLGSKESAGIKPWMVSLEVRIILTDKAQDVIDLYARAVEETFESPPTVPSLAGFIYLSLIDEEEEEKDGRSDSRQRVKTYQFHAIESNIEPVSVFAGSEDILAGSEVVLAGAETT